VLEAQPRLFIWPPELWRDATVFHAQFWLFAAVGAPIDILAIIVSAVLVLSLRSQRPNSGLALAGAAGFALALALWFAIVAPANSVLATWTEDAIPADFSVTRLRWEVGHMIVAAVKLVSFTLIALACVWLSQAERA
jgi:hypothetical protein